VRKSECNLCGCGMLLLCLHRIARSRTEKCATRPVGSSCTQTSSARPSTPLCSPWYVLPCPSQVFQCHVLLLTQQSGERGLTGLFPVCSSNLHAQESEGLVLSFCAVALTCADQRAVRWHRHAAAGHVHAHPAFCGSWFPFSRQPRRAAVVGSLLLRPHGRPRRCALPLRSSAPPVFDSLPLSPTHAHDHVYSICFDALVKIARVPCHSSALRLDDLLKCMCTPFCKTLLTHERCVYFVLTHHTYVSFVLTHHTYVSFVLTHHTYVSFVLTHHTYVSFVIPLKMCDACTYACMCTYTHLCIKPG
jgi:hypothetical protein